MRTIKPGDLEARERHQLLLSGVAPRPIALVSTVSNEGICNLAPFSFFNAYSSKPPIVAIGPAISSISGKAKDTLLNILETGECVISTVSYSMTEQVSLASCEYETGIDEFEKCGLSKTPATLVKAPLVKESPYSMECTLLQHIPLMPEVGGNGQLLLLEVQLFHISESVFYEEKIDPRRMDLVARMGYNWYARANGDAVFEVKKPRWNGVGFEALPTFVRESPILSGADLAQLAGVKEIPETDVNFPVFPNGMPTADNVETELRLHNPWGALFAAVRTGNHSMDIMHRIAHEFLLSGDSDSAWQTLFLAAK